MHWHCIDKRKNTPCVSTSGDTSGLVVQRRCVQNTSLENWEALCSPAQSAAARFEHLGRAGSDLHVGVFEHLLNVQLERHASRTSCLRVSVRWRSSRIGPANKASADQLVPSRSAIQVV